jgi:hypothetical protein
MRRTGLLLTAVVALFASGCRDDRVTISYRPAPGSTLAYTIHVESSSTTSLPNRTVRRSPDVADLTTTQRVLDAKRGTTRVEVTLSRAGIGARTFVMRFDRAAQLIAVESVEGIPAEALGTLGLSEIFPEAAGAPPDRPLRPGDTWAIEDQVQLAGMDTPATLRGTGRLVELGVVDGHDTATVTSETTLPLVSTSTSSEGVQTLTGSQRTSITVVYDLATGSVRRSSATTTAQFDLVLAPPRGQAGDPIRGTLAVDVRSEITRSA